MSYEHSYLAVVLRALLDLVFVVVQAGDMSAREQGNLPQWPTHTASDVQDLRLFVGMSDACETSRKGMPKRGRLTVRYDYLSGWLHIPFPMHTHLIPWPQLQLERQVVLVPLYAAVVALSVVAVPVECEIGVFFNAPDDACVCRVEKDL